MQACHRTVCCAPCLACSGRPDVAFLQLVVLADILESAPSDLAAAGGLDKPSIEAGGVMAWYCAGVEAGGIWAVMAGRGLHGLKVVTTPSDGRGVLWGSGCNTQSCIIASAWNFILAHFLVSPVFI